MQRIHVGQRDRRGRFELHPYELHIAHDHRTKWQCGVEKFIWRRQKLR